MKIFCQLYPTYIRPINMDKFVAYQRLEHTHIPVFSFFKKFKINLLMIYSNDYAYKRKNTLIFF